MHQTWQTRLVLNCQIVPLRTEFLNCLDFQEPSIINVPVDIISNTSRGAATASISWIQPAAYDNSGSQNLTSNYAPSDPFPIGITRVIYTSRDPSGNTAISSFTVTVEGRIK